MHLIFDIFQGLGIAAAVGIRPFLPALIVGILAAGHVEIHFNHTDYAFLQGVPFLIAMVVAGIVLAALEGRLGRERTDRGPGALLLAAIGVVAGGLLFAGALARGGYAVWPGWIAGVLCAALAAATTRPLFARVRARLDSEAAAAVPFYAEGIALILAALSVLAPPVGPIALVLLAWLLVAGRRREGQKYAGLRILR